MNADTAATLIQVLTEITKAIITAAKGEPAPDAATLKANIKAALAAHAADDGWLDKAIADATAAYDKDYPPNGIIPPLP